MNPLILLKSPKMLGAIAVLAVVGSAGVHYWLVKNERDQLRADKVELVERLDDREADIAALEQSLAVEREAAAIAAAERNEARRALEAFRAGRENDPEAMEWAAESLPSGELERLCQALPEMEGCTPAVEP